MSADKHNGDKNNPFITLTGRLVLRTFGKHSKSEHLGVFLVTDEGDYLRRPSGANPFMPNPLMPLAFNTIIISGGIQDYFFLAQTWKEAE